MSAVTRAAESVHKGVLIHGSMIITIELITPELAQEYMKKNVRNRTLRRKHVKLYEQDMREGKWRFKPIAICFDKNGNVVNGQHSLLAVIQSGIPQEFMVCRNTPDDVVAVMDIGIKRSMNDLAMFYDSPMESRRSAVAKIIKWGPANKSDFRFEDVLNAYTEFQDGIEFVCGQKRNARGLTASVLAVCARAYYTQDRARVERFMNLLDKIDGVQDNESAVIRLRDFLQRKGNMSSSSSDRAEVYKKTESALVNFLSGQNISRLQPSEIEHFPLAGAYGTEAGAEVTYLTP